MAWAMAASFVATLLSPGIANAAVASHDVLRVSSQASLASSRTIAGATVAGVVHVFAQRERGLRKVAFYVDDARMARTPTRIDSTVKYTLSTEAGFDTRKLSNGQHTVSARFVRHDGSVYKTTHNFTVKNLQTVTPTPTPTPTPAPTPTEPAVTDPVVNPAPGAIDGERVISAVNFNSSPAGRYTEAQLQKDFSTLKVQRMGVTTNGRYAAVVPDPADSSNRALEVRIEANKIGKAPFWELRFPDANEAYLSYRVRFATGFQWAKKGGKLPGLAGTSPTVTNWADGSLRPPMHCTAVAPDSGFSARHTWKAGGVLTQYLYHEDKTGDCADVRYSWGQTRVLGTDKWHQVVQRIKINDVGSRNAVIDTWIDGKLGTSSGLRLRRTNSYGVNTFRFDSYFGGGDLSWAHSREETIYYDDFRIWQPS